MQVPPSAKHLHVQRGKTHIYLNTPLIALLQKMYEEEAEMLRIANECRIKTPPKEGEKLSDLSIEGLKKRAWFLFETTFLHELLHSITPNKKESEFSAYLAQTNHNKGYDIGKVFEEEAYGADITHRNLGNDILRLFAFSGGQANYFALKTLKDVFQETKNHPIKSYLFPTSI